MARPKKDNADYFPHDSGMRNDARVKALRKKFKLEGYAIWNMLLEYLCNENHFQFEYNDFNLEIIAGDFDADTKQIQEVISYCLTLGLLQEETGFITCNNLRKRLEPVLLKRKRFTSGVSVTETPQSKVKESKVKNSKEKESNKERPLRAYEIPFPVESQEYKSWLEWEQHRKEIGHKITPTTAKKQFKFLGGRAGPEVCAIIDKSIKNGWTGLFEVKDEKKNKQNDRQATQRTFLPIVNPGNEGFGTFG